MVVMILQRLFMDELLTNIKQDFPELSFVSGQSYRWSPHENQITYNSSIDDDSSSWALLHELSHALLSHSEYSSDFELLKLEVAAWNKAQTLQNKYHVTINPDHIQNCLDTYREWLYQRSTCPTCNNTCLQTSLNEYRCFNCHSTWKVTIARFCRPYRLMYSQPTKKSPIALTRATFGESLN